MSDDLFAHTSGPRNAKIAVVGEAWGQEEERRGLPLVGDSGKLFDWILRDAGIAREACFCTNICNARPPRVPGAQSNDFRGFLVPTTEAKKAKTEPLNGLYPLPIVRSGIDRVLSQLAAVSPAVVVALGNVPFWAFSSHSKVRPSVDPSGFRVPGGIGDWRGSQLFTDRSSSGPVFPLLPIYHPAAVLRQWYLRPIIIHDLATRIPRALEGRWSRPPYSASIPSTFDEALLLLHQLRAKVSAAPTEIAVDLETHGRRVISCIGFATSAAEAFCIPLIRFTPQGTEPWWTFDQEQELVRLIRTILNHDNALLIGQNFAYDIQFLSKWWGIRRRVHWDTMVAQHVMYPDTPKDLSYLASLHCTQYYRYWKEDSKEWEAKGDQMQHLLYNCDDCLYTFAVYLSQKSAISQMGLEKPFNLKLREWHLAAEMTARGVLVDQKVRADMVWRVAEAVGIRQQIAQNLVPDYCLPEVGKSAKPWHGSAIQQQRLLYECLGLKSVYHRKTGNPTVNDEAVEMLKIRYPYLTRLLDCILELRSLRVFKSTYLDAATDFDDRWRCEFNVAGAKTMRWSSHENAFGRGLNLQNVSVGTEES